MWIKFNHVVVDRHAPSDEQSWDIGDVAELPDDYAEKLIASGRAEITKKPGTKVKYSTEKPD